MQGHCETRPYQVDPLVTQMLRLRVEGHSYDYIAAACGVNTTKVANTLRKVARELAEDREELIAKQRDQLHFLWRRTLQPWVGSAEAEKQPLPEKITQTLLKILEREAKLFGLDAPTKQELTHAFEDTTDTELIAEAKRLGIAADALRALEAANPPVTIELLEPVGVGRAE